MTRDDIATLMRVPAGEVEIVESYGAERGVLVLVPVDAVRLSRGWTLDTWVVERRLALAANLPSHISASIVVAPREVFDAMCATAVLGGSEACLALWQTMCPRGWWATSRGLNVQAVVMDHRSARVKWELPS